ncbi:hypothetical protein ACIQ1H_05360 [Lysinibacillus sp. NPDC097279]|uniref:hypothetical protein n=1 Tax=Lysinibacillus sp. NPDC097279 TaxID=3364143 RepID=UPI003811504D
MKAILQAMIHYSEFYNLTPPLSNEFNDWCKSVVNEMGDREIHLLYLAVNAALNKGHGCQKLMSIMFNELQRRKSEIEFYVTYANALLQINT